MGTERGREREALRCCSLLSRAMRDGGGVCHRAAAAAAAGGYSI